jgi:hypothetical protein
MRIFYNDILSIVDVRLTRNIGKDAVCNKDMGMSERFLLILIVLEKKREDRTTVTDSQIITSHRDYEKKIERFSLFFSP